MALKFNCLIQFRRFTHVDNGLEKVEDFDDHGTPQRAARMDVSDAEKVQAGGVGSNITRRFVVPHNDLTSDISSKDRLIFRGTEYNIFGVKDVGNRYRREITAGAKSSNVSNS